MKLPGSTEGQLARVFRRREVGCLVDFHTCERKERIAALVWMVVCVAYGFVRADGSMNI